jgi:hypothetical protein
VYDKSVYASLPAGGLQTAEMLCAILAEIIVNHWERLDDNA